MRRLPYDGSDPRPARRRGQRDFLPARRRNSADFTIVDPWFIPEDDPGMGTALGEDISDDDLYMRMNRRRERRNPDEVDRLERRALAGDKSAVRRLAARARGMRALDVDEGGDEVVRMRPEPHQNMRTDRPFFVRASCDGFQAAQFAARREFLLEIDFRELDPETEEENISRTRIDGFATPDVLEVRVDGKVAYRARRAR